MPTPVSVEQPATSTPRPSPTPDSEAVEEEVPAPTQDDGEGFSLPIDFTELRAAFVSGGKVTLLLFGLWALYVFVKAVVRWLLRQGLRVPLSCWPRATSWPSTSDRSGLSSPRELSMRGGSFSPNHRRL